MEGLGWARGPVRDACGSPGDGGDREEPEQWRRGPGWAPPAPASGPAGAPGLWPCLMPQLRIPLVPSQHSAALPLPPLAQESGEADLREDRRVILRY